MDKANHSVSFRTRNAKKTEISYWEKQKLRFKSNTNSTDQFLNLPLTQKNIH